MSKKKKKKSDEKVIEFTREQTKPIDLGLPPHIEEELAFFPEPHAAAQDLDTEVFHVSYRIMVKLLRTLHKDAADFPDEMVDASKDPATKARFNALSDALPMETRSQLAIYATSSFLYECYCSKVGGKAFDGDPLPSWEEFAADPTKAKQAAAWLRVGHICVSLKWAGFVQGMSGGAQ